MARLRRILPNRKRKVLCRSNLTHRHTILIVFYDSYIQRHFNSRMKPSSPKLPEHDDLFPQMSHGQELREAGTRWHGELPGTACSIAVFAMCARTSY